MINTFLYFSFDIYIKVEWSEVRAKWGMEHGLFGAWEMGDGG